MSFLTRPGWLRRMAGAERWQDLSPGDEILAHFRIEEVIGRGGGVVALRAVQRSTHRPVALEVLLDPAA